MKKTKPENIAALESLLSGDERELEIRNRIVQFTNRQNAQAAADRDTLLRRVNNLNFRITIAKEKAKA